ncbi:hypothetical protein K505DRAFT_371606 [Melanomma pulvis-pyrius CBS 109.77]|uniref:Uncharacterized protein n=1 Tax=Melanomma pulvis-pyrius CBS 109.77 TaxID=1314802 RepID=A0A6A6XSS1_9PLEO|nr:hypothetical protein K505DRAFT_371606 [Melanomma pulvis-pyrius CBS 109.77]
MHAGPTWTHPPGDSGRRRANGARRGSFLQRLRWLSRRRLMELEFEDIGLGRKERQSGEGVALEAVRGGEAGQLGKRKLAGVGPCRFQARMHAGLDELNELHRMESAASLCEAMPISSEVSAGDTGKCGAWASIKWQTLAFERPVSDIYPLLPYPAPHNTSQQQPSSSPTPPLHHSTPHKQHNTYSPSPPPLHRAHADRSPDPNPLTMPGSTISSVTSIIKPKPVSCGEECDCCGCDESCWCVVM